MSVSGCRSSGVGENFEEVSKVIFSVLNRILATILLVVVSSCAVAGQSMDNFFPWCIVAYDSKERTPEERVALLSNLGFTKYAYDWRDHHLDDMSTEMSLMKEAGIETIAVWLWLNASRDSVGHLSMANKRVFEILQNTNTETTIWMSMSPNFFEDLSQSEAMKKGREFVQFIADEARKINCSVALYNHTGWFADTSNQIEIIEALPTHDIRIVYSFHHAQADAERFSEIAGKIAPHLVAVNLGGVKKEGPKIITISEGDFEKDMIDQLIKVGYKGPWGILDHVEGKDAREVLRANIEGLRSLKIEGF